MPSIHRSTGVSLIHRVLPRPLLLGVLVGSLVLHGTPQLPAATGLRMTGINIRDGKAVVSWEGTGGPYQLLCRTNLTQDWSKVGPVVSGTSATNPAPAGPTCFFMVTSDLTPPAVPTGVQAQTNDCAAVTVRWNAAFDNFGGSGVRNYSIFRNGTLLSRVNAISNSIVDSTISSPATYNYTVVATDTVGNQSAPSAPVTVSLPNCNNRPPAALAGPDQTVSQGTAVTLNGSQSTDVDGSIVSYAWTLGDGMTGSGASVLHTYSLPGTYVATLTVTDDAGATATDSVVVTVTPPANQLPVASAGADQTVPQGTVVSLNGGQSTDADGSIVSYAWTFGDGTAGSGVSVTHLYNVPGTYVATLTVTDNAGATATDTVTITVTAVAAPNQAPVANAGPDQTVVAGTLVSFNGSQSYDVDSPITSYTWDFGDGNKGYGALASWVYSTPGTYTVTLRVTDGWAAASVDTAVVTVTAPAGGNQAPLANAGPDRIGTNKMPIQFIAAGSRDPDGGIVSYTWDYGDGNQGSGYVASHTYALAGQYVVRLTVADAAGATGTDTAVLTLQAAPNQLPIASAGSDQTWPVGTDFAFSGFASRDPDGSIVSYAWDFGDGTRASGVTTQHRFVNAGSYPVRLTVTDNEGGIATATVLANVTAAGVASVPSGTLLRGTNFGSSRDAVFKAVAVGRDGQVFVGGHYSGRIALLRLGPSSEVLWSYVDNFGVVEGIAVDGNGDILVTGYFSGPADFGGNPLLCSGNYDAFLAKFTRDGTHVWSRRFGGEVPGLEPNDCGFGVAVDTNDNSVVVTGQFQSQADFGGGPVQDPFFNFFVAKYSAQGGFLWSRHGEGVDYRTARAVAIDPRGNVFITGHFKGSCKFGSNWVTSGSSISDVFIASYSPAGQFQWVNNFGRAPLSYCRAISLVADANGDAVMSAVSFSSNNFGGLTLTNRGDVDIVLAKYAGRTGQHLWSKSFGSPYFDAGRGLAVDAANRITFAAVFGPGTDHGFAPIVPSGTLQNGPMVANFNSDGSLRWARFLPAPGKTSFQGLAVRPDGRSFVTGTMTGTLDCGSFMLTPQSTYANALLFELAP